MSKWRLISEALRIMGALAIGSIGAYWSVCVAFAIAIDLRAGHLQKSPLIAMVSVIAGAAGIYLLWFAWRLWKPKR